LKKHFKDQVSEEALTEISTLFDAALNEKLKVALAEKETELEDSNKTDMAKFKVDLVNKLSEYSAVAVEEFITENKPGIESDIKVSVSESVMKGLMALLKEKYIVVPEGETDVVADLEGKVTASNDKLNESINAGIEDKKQILEYEKALTFNRLIGEGDVTDVDAEKVLDLLEGIEAEDVEAFEEKAKIIIAKVIEDKEEDPDKGKKKDDLNENVNLDENDENNTDKSEIDKYLP
jgi:hypothetical protein